MSAFGNIVVQSQSNSSETVVQLATVEYLECLGVKEYFDRCRELGLESFNQINRDLILKMEKLTKDGRPSHPKYLVEMANYMEHTFNLRFQHIAHHDLSVRNAVAIYPGIRNFKEIRREFERITGKSVNAFERHLNCVLKQYARDTLRKECYTCTSTYCMESLQILRQNESDNARITAAYMILFACAQSERTWLNVIFKVVGKNVEVGITRPHPTVLVHGTPFKEKCADVYCEQIKMISGVNFYEAILACYFLYYVFHINLPPVDLETYQQFDNGLNLMSSV